MARTQEFYRNKGRLPRYSTGLAAMSNGMYLTNQGIPEGYARVLVNYDIDDTGSNIRNKEGRVLLDNKTYVGAHNLGAFNLSDYIYAYNNAETEIESIKDLLMSYGHYARASDYVPASLTIPAGLDIPMYISKIAVTTDNNSYDSEGNITIAGDITTVSYDNIWSLYCDKGSETFNEVTNEDIGYVSARTINNAYVYDKAILEDVGKPISTILSNEIYAFSAAPIAATVCPANPERNEFTSFAKADLSKILLKQKADGSYALKRKVLTPRVLNVSEAMSYGYNILSESPYVFDDVDGGAPVILGLVLYKTESDDMPILSPGVGTAYAMRAYYQYGTAGSNYQYKVEIKNAADENSSYILLEDWTTFTSGDPLFIDFTPTYNKTLVQITIRISGDATSEYTLPHLFDCDSATYAKLENKEYDLSTAKGMTNWQGCIGLYGVTGATDTIFFSDIEDPSYFPFPNNITTFDNEILAVHKYLDMLLVITTDSIWLLSPGATFATTSQKRIMSNIFIPELDAMNVVVLKDQIFFKTDTQFYVLKPNSYTSDASDLKNYTNSIAVANYTRDFTAETINILNAVYRELTFARSLELHTSVKFTDFDVLGVQSAIKNSEVHYVYTIKPYIGAVEYGNLNLHLVYNTITRSYRIYLIGVGDDTVSHSALLYRNKQSGAYYELIPYNLATESHVLIVKGSDMVVDDNIVIGDWELTPNYNNYQYIDTGDVALDDMYNKRFREVQFNLYNKGHASIRFYSDFRIDGRMQIASTKYAIQQITDPEDENFGLIYVTASSYGDVYTTLTAEENLILYGDTTLDEEDGLQDPAYWQLDLSAFPGLAVKSVRLKVRGKGKRASLQLLNTSLQPYALSTMTMVYRIMNVR